MINSIINQQKEERNALLKSNYICRLEDNIKEKYLGTSIIKLITGPRRAGKSVLALQLLEKHNFAYLNFDDELLLKHFDEDAVIKGLHVFYNNFEYLLLDEVQNLPNWELWVNKLYRRGYNLVITGSNSNLLSSEMASVLTGRFIQISVLPFSFAETLRYDSTTPIESSKLPEAFNRYIFDGGFPEILQSPGVLKNYLSTLFDSILLKDILKRFRIRQTQQLYDLSNYFISNYTNLFTFNQITEVLDFNSVATVQKFVKYLEVSYLFQHITRYQHKFKGRQKSAQKMYVIDNGFVKARSFELSPNYGRLLENVVFVELLRRGYTPELSLFYYRTRNDREIDFVIRDGYVTKQLIQVCYELNQRKTIQRETDALFEASEELNCSNLLLITGDKEDLIIKGKLEIKLVPAYKWLTSDFD